MAREWSGQKGYKKGWAAQNNVSSGGGASYSLDKAWRLDGVDEWINVPYDASINITDNLSAEIIFNCVAADTGANQHLFNRRITSGLPYQVYIQDSTGYLIWYIQEVSGTRKQYEYRTDITGATRQIGMTFSGGTLTVFLDGADVTGSVTKTFDDTMTAIESDTVNPIRIGNIESGSYYFKGRISRACLWSTTVLTEANFASLWNSGTPNVDPNTLSTPVMVLDMEESDSTAANGVLDSSGNGNHGTVQNSQSWDLMSRTATIITKSVDFDGTADTISMGDVLDKADTDAFSIALWARADSTTSSGSVYLVSKQTSGAGNPGYNFYRNNQTIGTFILNDAAATEYINVTVASVMSDTSWHHYVMTYDGSGNASGVSFYKDASGLTEVIGQDTLAGSMANSGPFRINGRLETAAGFFDGHITRVQVFDKVLSASEISELYDLSQFEDYTITTFQSDTEASWILGNSSTDLETGSGVLDETANNYDGTAASMTNAANLVEDIP